MENNNQISFTNINSKMMYVELETPLNIPQSAYVDWSYDFTSIPDQNYVIDNIFFYDSNPKNNFVCITQQKYVSPLLWTATFHNTNPNNSSIIKLGAVLRFYF
ncbi:hypothetical protein ACTFRK_18240 [Bacillus cereus group sp. MYBK227-2]|uniref:hypothetical protein n=1 Tax=Bacillus cereus group sp. MYBK227-2 TaxID=3450653 RepID=UPI003F7975F7